ncbi:MAG TPA: CHRD domain-containing protein [Actinomycetota bacterium]|nr:CHRD domain-containing protein [Actinomycetota bacterium]
MKKLLVPALALFAALLLGSCNPGDDEGGSFSIDLSGANEVCDADTCGGNGTGTAEVDINSDENQICYEITLEGVQNVQAAHIHSGSAEEAGPVVVNLEYEGDDQGADKCVDGVSESDLEDISEDPSNFYVNVHSEQYPDGAVRGQLAG